MAVGADRRERAEVTGWAKADLITITVAACILGAFLLGVGMGRMWERDEADAERERANRLDAENADLLSQLRVHKLRLVAAPKIRHAPAYDQNEGA